MFPNFCIIRKKRVADYQLLLNDQVGWLVWFYSISTTFGCLMPNPLYIYIYIYIYIYDLEIYFVDKVLKRTNAHSFEHS